MIGTESQPHPGSVAATGAERARRRAEALATEGSADLVLTGGSVVAVDAVWTTYEAIATRGDRIVAIGSARDVASLVGPATRLVDLRGRTVLPGFQDAHCHPVHGGLALIRCELHGLRGVGTYTDAIRRYADANPDEAWIRGDGWSMDDFPGGNPPKAVLDAVVPDRPVAVSSRDGHSLWVNSRTLAIAGITAATADPVDGVIIRDEHGEPAGTLHEGATDLVEAIQPRDTPAELERGLVLGQAYLHGLGITAWQDASVEPLDEAAYRAVAGRGELTGRVVGALWWDRERGAGQIEELVERRARGAIGGFAPTSVKIMQDGVLENFSGALLEPYRDAAGRPTDNIGRSFIDAQALKQHVTDLDRLGFQVHFHAIGDRAVREALDAFEAALVENGRTDNRHHISHIQVIHPADIPRFRRLGVAANMQPLWAAHEGQMDNLTIPFLGPERAGWQYPFASLRRSGTMLCAGSDWAVSTPDPLLQMEVAVNRVSPELRGRAKPFLPSERLTLPDAIAAFTTGTAFVQHMDDETGSLEPGKLADLVVLDRDLFDREAGEIGDARVVATFVGGIAVHELAALES